MWYQSQSCFEGVQNNQVEEEPVEMTRRLITLMILILDLETINLLNGIFERNPYIHETHVAVFDSITWKVLVH